MTHDHPTNTPLLADTAPGKGKVRTFVAFFGLRTGRGSGAAEKYSPRAEFVSILVMLLFGILIAVVVYRQCFGRP